MRSCSSALTKTGRGPRRQPGSSATAKFGVLLLLASQACIVITRAHRPQEKDCGADGAHSDCNEGSLQADSHEWTRTRKEPELEGSRPENQTGTPRESSQTHSPENETNQAALGDEVEESDQSADQSERVVKKPIVESGNSATTDQLEDCGPLSKRDDVKEVDRKKVVETFPEVLCKFEGDVLADLQKPASQGGSVNGFCPIEDFASGGYGCAFYPDAESRSGLEVKEEGEPACACLKSQFQICWNPDIDEFLSAIGKGDNASSIEVGKAFLVGKCFTPVWVWITVAVLTFLCVMCVVAACLKKTKGADKDKDPRLAGTTRDPRKAGNQGS